MSLSDDQPHTRTRLPVGDLPPPQPGRQPRPLRTLLTVMGILVLLVVAISFANRDKPDPHRGSGTAAADGSGGGGKAAPTAATGQRPVDTTSNGIPAGFPHTDQGAQSAAANYAVALGSAGMFDADTRHSVIDTLADPAAADALRNRLDSAFAQGAAAKYGLGEHGTAPAGLTFISRTIPVGTKVEQYGDAAARVAVWSSGLIGLAGQGSTQPVAENWFTLTLSLRWVGNDWKVVDFHQQPGPAPVNGDQQAANADEIKSAAEQYGGFRYAR